MNQELIRKTSDYVKEKFYGEATGHDWWHIYRVWKDSKKIAKEEGADSFIVEMAALLHDLEDFKFNEKKDGEKQVKNWLESQNLEQNLIDKIVEVVEDISFKGASVKDESRSLEAQVVKDADRLDTMGAMGIARTFAYGGKVGRPLYDPNVKPTMHQSFEQYKKEGNSSSINHFYEKLLLLKDRMNTRTGRKVAEGRHKFMEKYLEQFYKEWEGEV